MRPNFKGESMTQPNFHSDGIPTSDRLRDSQRLRNEVRDDDTTFEDPRIARERAEEREVERAPAPAHAELEHDDSTAHSRFGASFLASGNTDEPWQQWRQIQERFVDDPRSAVSDAHGLVGELMNDIVRKFEGERTQMEQRWSSGEDVSTEDLRRCLQSYRDFFGRLLTNVGDAKA
jgi:hypothetical protein